jgi:hypothetical protein
MPEGQIHEPQREWEPGDQGSDAWEDPKMTKLKETMADIGTVDELLDRAQEYVPNADPVLLAGSKSGKQFHLTSGEFLKEAWQRLENMPASPERDRLGDRAGRIQRAFHKKELDFLD